MGGFHGQEKEATSKKIMNSMSSRPEIKGLVAHHRSQSNRGKTQETSDFGRGAKQKGGDPFRIESLNKVGNVVKVSSQSIGNATTKINLRKSVIPLKEQEKERIGALENKENTEGTQIKSGSSDRHDREKKTVEKSIPKTKFESSGQ